MKSLLFGIVLVSLCSCGGDPSSQKENQVQVGESLLEGELFVLPKLNSYRILTVDDDLSSIYEDMTIRSHNEGRVLGDKAFYVMVNSNEFSFYNEMHLKFYDRTKINNIFYIDLKNTTLPFNEIKKEHLPILKLKDMTANFNDGLVWGKHDLDYPENDMKNKAYIIRTEEMKESGNVEFKAESMYLIWFECKGDIRPIKDFVYSCGKYNLKLHYKLLDYSLTSNKI